MELKRCGKPVPNMLIYTLYGAQHCEEQSAVFSKTPDNSRKLIFSTNIAETSLTIDGIGYVVDCGYVKQKNYNPRTGMDALIVVPISRVQAIQRTGRAGRTQAGKCFRLYSEKFYQEDMRARTQCRKFCVSIWRMLFSLSRTCRLRTS
jgi:ATP-dependent RNA helicase DHX8/PRP22